MSTTEANATAAANELALANDVDLSQVEGTGTDGKITVSDVRSYIEASGAEVVPVDEATIDALRAEAEWEQPPGEQVPTGTVAEGSLTPPLEGEETTLPETVVGGVPGEVPVEAPELDYGNLTPYEGEPAAGEVEEIDEEVQAVVREGDWVKVVPEEAPARLVGSDWVVERSTIHRTTGPSNISNDIVEYQKPDDPLLIKSRLTGERFQVTREQLELPGSPTASTAEPAVEEEEE